MIFFKKSKSFGLIAVLVCLALLSPWVAVGTASACGEAGAMDQTILLPIWNTLLLVILGVVFGTDQAEIMLANSSPLWMMQVLIILITGLMMGKLQLASSDGLAKIPLETQEAVSAYIKHKTVLVALNPDQVDKWSILGSSTKPGATENMVESLVMVLPIPAKGKLSSVDPTLKPTDMITADEKWDDKSNGLWAKTYRLKDKYKADFDLIKIVWPVSLLKGASKTVPAAGPARGVISNDDSVTVYLSEK